MMLTVDERYELFKSTLFKCCSDILSKNDDTFKYILFEELPIDITSFLHHNTLDVLIHEGYIDESIYNKCSELREAYIDEEKNIFELSDVEKIKSSIIFCRMLNLADEIIKLLYI